MFKKRRIFMGSSLQNTEKMLLSLDVWITDEDQLTLSSFIGCESVWCTYFNNEWKKRKGFFFHQLYYTNSLSVTVVSKGINVLNKYWLNKRHEKQIHEFNHWTKLLSVQFTDCNAFFKIILCGHYPSSLPMNS